MNGNRPAGEIRCPREARSPWTGRARLIAVTGHYGSGKTELAVNLAIQSAAAGLPAALADLDIVNPYFRSLERRQVLEERGICLIAPPPACVGADIPVLPPQLWGLLRDPAQAGILDVGGDPAGARVLSALGRAVPAGELEVLLVLNASRPQTGSVAGALACIRGIEAAAGLPIGGLVNNTHLCGLTRPADVAAGAALARAVSEQTGIPLRFHAVARALIPALSLEEPVFPMDLCMRRPWE